MPVLSSKTDQEKKLVLFQLLATEPQLRLSVSLRDGTTKTYTRDEIIDHVENMDEVGIDYINTHMEFMRALKTGRIHELIAEAEEI